MDDELDSIQSVYQQLAVTIRQHMVERCLYLHTLCASDLLSLVTACQAAMFLEQAAANFAKRVEDEQQRLYCDRE